MPINIRPPGWRHEVVTNLSGIGIVASTPEERLTAASLMAAVVSQSQQLKQGRRLLFRMLPTWWLRLLPIWLRLVFNLQRQGHGGSTAVLSNLGRVEEGFDFGFGPEEVTEFWFSPPIGLRTRLALGAASRNGRLHLVLRYRRTLFDAEASRRFSGLLLECLFELGQAPDSPTEARVSAQDRA
jgi:NRPS condensation-like uncharacterized protein